eukprot:UN3002
MFPDVPIDHTLCHAIVFVGTCVMLSGVSGIRLSKAGLLEHRDVAGLVVCTLLEALEEDSLLNPLSVFDPRTRGLFIEDLVVTGSDNKELIAFVPAVWMACKEKDGAQAPMYKIEDSQM